MHIAYLIPTIDRIGGAERQLLLLANGMAERGWRVTLISLYGDGQPLANQLTAANLSFISLGMTSGLSDAHGWNTLRQLIKSAPPDILHSHLAQAALMGRGIRAIAPLRVLIDTIHSPATGSSTRRRGYRLTSSIPDCVTAVSRTAARTWLDAGIVDERTITVIPNGIDSRRWPLKTTGARRSNRSDEFRWLAVGRLEPVKDYATMLHAFAMLPQTARLSICGSGPLENELRALATRLDLQERVLFLGFQTNLAQLMQAHDAFVLSSRWEGLPMALLEASACGLPAVFTDIDGCREVLTSSSLPTAPVGNPKALAIAMKALMNLPESARIELGHRGRKQIVSRFDLSSVLDQWELLYRQLLAKNPKRRRFRLRASLSLPANSLKSFSL
ncbi:glycosyltransferase [Occallatibacter savannae]|uniref:glycosyltransferase n=1 Tax=Occallatibacter savannae TaxID=1002691 RepID=UPI000D688668|nr:glycosyltransferase [Occallatibacter savannae]